MLVDITKKLEWHDGMAVMYNGVDGGGIPSYRQLLINI